MTRATWILESDVFPDSHSPLRAAVADAGHRLLDWDDAWWANGFPSDLAGPNTFFHGSLGNAARINDELDWSPGSFCNTSAFRCSSWYDSTREFLLHADWRFLPANEFVDSAEDVAASLGCTDRIFVRPDSPLKPFSGRVLDVASVTLRALDHGFYFDDESLPIVAAPIRNVGRDVAPVFADGIDVFRDRVRDRILRDHADDVFVNRCSECSRIVMSPEARQCLWCGHDWH